MSISPSRVRPTDRSLSPSRRSGSSEISLAEIQSSPPSLLRQPASDVASSSASSPPPEDWMSPGELLSCLTGMGQEGDKTTFLKKMGGYAHGQGNNAAEYGKHGVSYAVRQGKSAAGYITNLGTSARLGQQQKYWLKRLLIGGLLALAGKPAIEYGYDYTTGTTPLMKAVRSRDIDRVDYWLNEGENPNQANIWGANAHYYAARSGQAQMIQRLENARAKQVEALVQQAGAGNIKAVNKLLAQGLDINQPNAEGTTPLGLAAIKGQHRMIAFLADQGADVNKIFTRNMIGKDLTLTFTLTPLMAAAANHHLEAIHALVEAKADVNQANKEGYTALMFAAATDDLPESIHALAKAGADVNQADKEGHTALMVAANNNHPEVIHALAKAGADVNQADKEGHTALMVAAQEGRLQAAKALIAIGADPCQKDGGWLLGRTAYDMAVANNHHTLADFLKQAQEEKRC